MHFALEGCTRVDMLCLVLTMRLTGQSLASAGCGRASTDGRRGSGGLLCALFCMCLSHKRMVILSYMQSTLLSKGPCAWQAAAR